MSAVLQAEVLRGLVPCSAEHHRRNGLLPASAGWKFFHAPKGAGLACFLCGHTAAYVSASTGLPTCAKHAKDF